MRRNEKKNLMALLEKRLFEWDASNWKKKDNSYDWDMNSVYVRITPTKDDEIGGYLLLAKNHESIDSTPFQYELPKALVKRFVQRIRRYEAEKRDIEESLVQALRYKFGG